MFAWTQQGQMTLGKTISIGFGAVLFLYLAQSVYSNFSLQRTWQGFSQIKQIHQDTIETYAFEAEITELQRNVLAFNYSGYQGLIPRVHQLHKKLNADLKAIREGTQDPRRQDLLQRMGGHLTSYGANFEAAVSARRERDRLLDEQLGKPFAEVSRQLDLLSQRALAQGNHRLASHAALARGDLGLAHRLVLQFVEEPDSQLIDQVEKRLKQVEMRFGPLVRQASSRDKALLANLRQRIGAYRRAFIRTVQTTRTYLQLIYVVMAGEAAEIGFLSDELKQETLSIQQEIETSLQQELSSIIAFSLTATIGAMLLGAFLSWLITARTAGPIRRITESFSALAAGRYDASIPGRGRKDEIGALASAAQVFKEKALELDNASRYKSEFLANMSHELRTPLNSLLILARMLANNAEGNLSDQQIESAEVIQDSGNDLLRLINDILDLSKVEAGRMDVILEEQPLEHFLTRMERQFRHIAEARGLLFEIGQEPGLPERLVTDWVKVEQVVRNLLSNAFKFTSEGRVRVRLHRPEANRTYTNDALGPLGAVAISVEDTGIGIPEDKMGQIFEAFRQVDGTTSRKYGGTGLGLSISQRFSQLLGGEVQVDSELGQGTQFTLILPLSPPKEGKRIDPSDERDDRILDYQNPEKTLLVVDDDQRNRYALQQILKPRFAKVFTADNGEEALKMLQIHQDVDLVIMDIMMPVMSGLEAIEEIRKTRDPQDLPIVALTAKALASDKEQCLAAGANDYLSKPVDEGRLLRRLKHWLGQVEQPQKAKPATAPSATRAPEEPAHQPSLAHLRVLLVDDDVKASFLLARSLGPLVAQVRLAKNGAETLEKLNTAPLPHLLLAKVAKPAVSGLELVEKVRAQSQFDSVRIIALSVSDSPDDEAACLRAGAQGYITKPWEPQQLIQLIQLMHRLAPAEEPPARS